METTASDASLNDAASAIAALLSPKEEKPAATTQPEQQPEKVAEQVPPAPEPVQAESEEETETPPPRSLKVKTPEGEQELPEEEVIKGYLRNADYTRKTQALADEKKKFETEEAAKIRAVSSQYSQQLQVVTDVLTALHPPAPDWSARAKEVSPEQLVAERGEWDKAQQAIAQLKEERAKIAKQEEAEQAESYERFIALEQAKLEDVIPAFKDPVKAVALADSMTTFAAKTYGITAQEFATATRQSPSKFLRIVHDAMQHHDQQAKAPDVKNKIEKVLETSGPGARQTSKPSGADAVVSRALKSGRTDDVADAIAALTRTKSA